MFLRTVPRVVPLRWGWHRYVSSVNKDEKLKQIIQSLSFGDKQEMPKIIPRVESIPKDESIPPPSSSIDLDRLAKDISDMWDLPSKKERLQLEFSRRLNHYIDSFQDTIFTASRTLNDVTGYNAIEKLRQQIDELEQDLKVKRQGIKHLKAAYTKAIHERSTMQKEMNDLLTRKNNWLAEDLEKFTNLYRNDHTYEQEELKAQKNLEDAEQLVESIQLKLTQLILTRYHEEQIWSDKIRRVLTWGTMALMGVNILLFIVATFFVEPWKRRRLVSAFEEKVAVMLATTEADKDSSQPITTDSAPITNFSANISDESEIVLSQASVPPHASAPIKFTVGSIELLQTSVASAYTTLSSTDDFVTIDKSSLAAVSVSAATIGCLLGAALYSVFS